MKQAAAALFVVLALAPAAIAARAPALSSDRIDYWTAIARCETGGNWAMRGSTYEGGTGFYVGTWRWWASELGLLGRYPHAWMAPPRVQMQVSEYGLRVHNGYWGCAAVV